MTVDPARILDTRSAIGVPGTSPVPANSSIDVQVAGVGGVPATATGVIVTITGTDATVNTFITAYPTGTTRPTASVLNPLPNIDVANTVTMSIGAGGKISLYNHAGTVDLVADVTGYLLPQSTPTGTPAVNGQVNLLAYSGSTVGAVTYKDNGCADLGTTGEVILDVALPANAFVSKVDFRYYDTSVANMTLVFHEIDQPSASATPVVTGTQTTSTGQVGYGTVTLNPPSNGEGPATHFYIDAISGVGGAGGANWFCGATVYYNVPAS